MEELVIILFCLLINAILAAFETAFVSISRGQLRHAASMHEQAGRVLHEPALCHANILG